MADSEERDYLLIDFRDEHYPYQLWYLLGCFIAAVGAFNFAPAITSKILRRRSSADVEQVSSLTKRKSSLRNLPAAIVNMFRIVAFRWTLKFGESYTFNTAEVFVTVAYIVALLTWSFINSQYHVLLCSLDFNSPTGLLSYRRKRQETCSILLGEQSRYHCDESVASHDLPWDKEQSCNA
jgi:hypothetical protein